MKHTMVLRGPLPSKKNLYRRSARGGMYIPRTVKAALDSLQLQAQSQWQGRPPALKPDIRVALSVCNMRSDPDNKLTALLDVLRRAGVIKDDCANHVGSVSVSAHQAPRSDYEDRAVIVLEVNE